MFRASRWGLSSKLMHQVDNNQAIAKGRIWKCVWLLRDALQESNMCEQCTNRDIRFLEISNLKIDHDYYWLNFLKGFLTESLRLLCFKPETNGERRDAATQLSRHFFLLSCKYIMHLGSPGHPACIVHFNTVEVLRNFRPFIHFSLATVNQAWEMRGLMHFTGLMQDNESETKTKFYI